MDELMDILMEINPDIDYETETRLIDGKVLDSFSIVSLVAEISDAFDIEISPKYLVPENFNSAKAMWNMICKIQEDED
ncbi:MAG: acyl carrier protein [Oscillospiraceae bacterium]|nr:acyl carrier protein [Oscillospiraceae bacterium]